MNAESCQLDAPSWQKLKARLRKRAKLPPNSKWLNPKYDPAFVYQLMSDDEDEYGPEDVKTGNFVSHAPLYRSEEVRSLIHMIRLCR